MADETTTATTDEFRLEPYQVILRPLVTEKGMHRSTRNNQYAFEVHLQATKDDVRRAVEDLFNVKVDNVRTLVVPGKMKRQGRFEGKTPTWKKAIVRLKKDQVIAIFDNI